VPRHEADSSSDRHQKNKEGPRALPFSRKKKPALIFSGSALPPHLGRFLPFDNILDGRR